MANSQLLEVYLDKNPQQEKRQFSCNLCSYRTDRRNNLKRHCSTMHEQSATLLECCGSNFVNKAALRLHTAAYHRHGYVCTICHRVFCRRALLRRHHAVHSGFKEWTCNQCDYATSHRSNLDRHKKIHDNSVEKVQQQETSPSSHSASIASSSQNSSSSRSSSETSFAKETIPYGRDIPMVDPILASLLARPSSSFQGEMLHWVYHSPFDSYQPTSVRQLDHFSHIRQQLQSAADRSDSLLGLNYPPRHTIDGILSDNRVEQKAMFFPVHHHGGLGAADPLVVTTVSNHWSVGHLSYPLRDAIDLSERSTYPDATATIEETQSVSGVKRHHLESSFASAELNEESGDESNNYIPKKLRMSKRYQIAPV